MASFGLYEDAEAAETADLLATEESLGSQPVPRRPYTKAALAALGLVCVAAIALKPTAPRLESTSADAAPISRFQLMEASAVLAPTQLGEEFRNVSTTAICEDAYSIVDDQPNGLTASWGACADACVRDYKCRFFAWKELYGGSCWFFWDCATQVPAEQGQTLYQKQYNGTAIYTENQVEYAGFAHDVFCTSSTPLLNMEADYLSRTALFSFDACRASCTAMIDCNVFLWKDAPAVSSLYTDRYHCALFKDCLTTEVYQDTTRGETQLYTKTAREACHVSDETAYDFLGRQLTVSANGTQTEATVGDNGTDINFLVLTMDTHSSSERRSHGALNNTLSQISNHVEMIHGVDVGSYGSVAEQACRQELVPLNLTQIQNAVWSLPSYFFDRSEAFGALGLALGHVAMWTEAAALPGWSVLMEDDAVLELGWTHEDLVQFIGENSTGGIVDLEARGCLKQWGSAAYAVTQEKAKELLRKYMYEQPVDVFLWQIHAPNAVGQVVDARGNSSNFTCPNYTAWPMSR